MPQLPTTRAFGRVLGTTLALAAAAMAPVGAARADAALQFQIGEIAGDQWRLAGVEVELTRDDRGGLGARIRVTEADLPDPLGRQTGVLAECQGLALTTRRVACRDLRLQLADLDLRGELTYQRDSGDVTTALQLVLEAPARLRLHAALRGERWQADVSATSVPMEALAPLADLLGASLPSVSGTLGLKAHARGGKTLEGLVFELDAEELGGSNAAGTVAAESLAVELAGSAWPARAGAGLDFAVRGRVLGGEAYVEPVYASLAEHPVRFMAHGRALADRFHVEPLVVEQSGTLHADAQAALQRDPVEGWRLESARVRIPHAELPGAYTVLLQPFLAGSALGALDTAGTLRGELALGGAGVEWLWLELSQVDIDDAQARLAVYDLSGDLWWGPSAAPPGASVGAGSAPAAGEKVQQLRWSGGFVYGVPFGAAGLRLEPRDGRWVLDAPVAIPVLDGVLEIDALEAGDLFRGETSVRLDARLQPIGMRALSHALDWPPLSGSLSGALPGLRYQDGLLDLGGALRAQVFDGEIIVDDLSVARPLGPLARLQAEVTLRGLELQQVTEALSFGLMTGRLDGEVRGLQMIDWRPVAFDARLYTPSGDRSRRRISQRAVDNIASIGGGGAGVLSTGFLRFFEQFSYEAFALGCRLERDVCAMSGLAPADGGYVILRGSGLPRIDVMGFANRVSWSALLAQLEGIMESEGPEIR